MIPSSIEGSIALKTRRNHYLGSYLVFELGMCRTASVFRRTSIGHRHPLSGYLDLAYEKSPASGVHKVD